MSATDTRDANYFDARDGGQFTRQQRIILNALSKQDAWKDFSLQEIKRLTGLDINVVSGRVNELKNRAFPVLVETLARKCTVTGRKITPVRIHNELEH